ncbi:MAG: hypothetical protein HYU36_09175 [Planctomycetes bacterium]|nr:hypothetical protein [Planctomycetota bacterium]
MTVIIQLIDDKAQGSSVPVGDFQIELVSQKEWGARVFHLAYTLDCIETRLQGIRRPGPELVARQADCSPTVMPENEATAKG